MELTVQSALTGKLEEPLELPVGGYSLQVTNTTSCPGLVTAGLNTTVTVTEGDSYSLVFWQSEAGLEVRQSQHLNRIEMPGGGKPYVKVLWSGED